MAGPNSSLVPSSLSKLQALNGLFAIYKESGSTSADVLNKLKRALLKGNTPKSKSTILSFMKAKR